MIRNEGARGYSHLFMLWFWLLIEVGAMLLPLYHFFPLLFISPFPHCALVYISYAPRLQWANTVFAPGFLFLFLYQYHLLFIYLTVCHLLPSTVVARSDNGGGLSVRHAPEGVRDGDQK
uniref:Uncharacterized protein n=1 Tax=Trypanosoma congolense (strain IL3000) TaxID=1068625 RepID=G0UL19_TRYCI|nr:hypothetical protein, unlikely [Trypanosoma congolense IL3000]